MIGVKHAKYKNNQLAKHCEDSASLKSEKYLVIQNHKMKPYRNTSENTTQHLD